MNSALSISPILLIAFSSLALAAPPVATPASVHTPATPPSRPADFAIYLLAGQSNMAGRGTVSPEDAKPAPRVIVLDSHDQWVSQGEPIHFDKSVAGVGPGFTFAKLMAEKLPGVTIGLVPCAVGGTDISRWKPGADLYENTVRRGLIAAKFGTLKGILWHQGESSSGRSEKAEVYGRELREVIEGFRRDLHSPDLPFIAGEIGRFTYPTGPGKFAPVVNREIDALPAAVPHTAAVSSEDLVDRGDRLHFDTPSQKEFGKRYFDAIIRLQ